MAMLSSPLAAMQPPPCPRPWGCGRDIADASRSRNPGTSSNFNFRDLSMVKSQPEYFSLKQAPVRGSSPTASLAADLSQNFHIDQSPQLPTPRRSLFTSGLFEAALKHEGATTPPIRWEGVTTPPIPSSSPGFGAEPMDISPLPHKLPFSFAQKKSIQSPSRNATVDEDMISPCDPSPNPLLDQKHPPIERRKSNLIRPSLTRTKCFSTSATSLPRIKRLENQPPQFTFGAGGKGATSTIVSSLDECFVDSPPSNRSNVFGGALVGPPRPRQLFAHSNSLNRGNGSPIQGQLKTSVASTVRPRKLFRRSLSMFEHPADVMKSEGKGHAQPRLESIMDVDEVHRPKLPHFVPEDKPDSLPRINQETMIQVLNGDFKNVYGQTMVIDCRFEYEYNGGHIDGALNFNDKEQLSRELFDSSSVNGDVLIVLHCEYSAHRAPLMAQHIRQQDRAYNAAQYPKLTYPEIYILDGGYSSFFKNHCSRCFPQNYVEMDSKDHEMACERGLNKIRQRSKLSRAQTFAFGQQACRAEESPSRSSGSPDFSMDLASNRIHARRMASY